MLGGGGGGVRADEDTPTHPISFMTLNIAQRAYSQKHKAYISAGEGERKRRLFIFGRSVVVVTHAEVSEKSLFQLNTFVSVFT